MAEFSFNDFEKYIFKYRLGNFKYREKENDFVYEPLKTFTKCPIASPSFSIFEKGKFLISTSTNIDNVVGSQIDVKQNSVSSYHLIHFFPITIRDNESFYLNFKPGNYQSFFVGVVDYFSSSTGKYQKKVCILSFYRGQYHQVYVRPLLYCKSSDVTNVDNYGMNYYTEFNDTSNLTDLLTPKDLYYGKETLVYNLTTSSYKNKLIGTDYSAGYFNNASSWLQFDSGAIQAYYFPNVTCFSPNSSSLIYANSPLGKFFYAVISNRTNIYYDNFRIGYSLDSSFGTTTLSGYSYGTSSSDSIIATNTTLKSFIDPSNLSSVVIDDEEEVTETLEEEEVAAEEAYG